VIVAIVGGCSGAPAASPPAPSVTPPPSAVAAAPAPDPAPSVAGSAAGAPASLETVLAISELLWPIAHHDPASLSDPERTFMLVSILEGEVNNGGFDQYYFNTAGDGALDTPAALRAIGAEHTAAIVERANAVFGAAGPPRDRHARQEALLALGDDTSEFGALDTEFFAYPDPLTALLGAYVTAHASEIRGAH
jgi:hypothetical protein